MKQPRAKLKSRGRSRADSVDNRRRSKARTAKPRVVDVEKLKYARLKDVYRALKKAKQFEVAKVVRRLKSGAEKTAEGAAASDPDKLQKQLEAAKSADLTKLTNTFAEKCGWDIRLKPCPGSQAEVAASGNSDAHAREVVDARLMAATCVKQAAQAALESVSARLPKPPATNDMPRGAHKAAQTASDLGSDGGSEDGPPPALASADEGESDGEPAPLPEALAEVMSKGDVDLGGEVLEGSDMELEDAGHSASEDEVDDSGVVVDIGAKRKRDSKQGHPAGKPKPAKRPGQRQRRKLYEKMYGEQAAHIQAMRQQPDQHVVSDVAGSSSHGNAPGDEASAAVAHPSWAAKQREKELCAMKPQGKKVVFGDDGDTVAVLHSAADKGQPGGVKGESLRPERSRAQFTGGAPARAGGAPVVRAGRTFVQRPPRSDSVKAAGEVRARERPGTEDKGTGRPGKGTDSTKRPATLHPSWEASKMRREAEARQRQTLLTAPAGKKLRFDSDDDDD